MSKPVSRGMPFALPPRPRRCSAGRGRSCPSARGQVIVAGRCRAGCRGTGAASMNAASRLLRGRDRVDVAGEVEVEVLHRHDLRVAAAGRAALDAEDRPERRLAQAEDRPLADLAEPLRERDGRRRLALARRRGRDRRDVDDLRVGPVAEALEGRQLDLGLVAAVQLDLVGLQPGARDLGDRRAAPPGRSPGSLPSPTADSESGSTGLSSGPPGGSGRQATRAGLASDPRAVPGRRRAGRCGRRARR